MRKLAAIAWKELYTTLTDRNLLLIMFASPLALSTIIGLAFGGLGSATPSFAEIPVAVVNLDQGVDVAALANANGEANQGRNQLPNDFTFNFGEQVASLLLSQPLTATEVISGAGMAFDVESFTCDLVDDEANTASNGPFQGSLDDLLAATKLDDPAAARAGVERGEYAVAVIIPPRFTMGFLPRFDFSDAQSSAGDSASTGQQNSDNVIEVYGNQGKAVSASIVRSIVEGITNQFLRLTVTLEASFDTLRTNVDLANTDPQTLTAVLTVVNTDTFSVLGCLFVPGINPITLEQQPLDKLQEEPLFARIIVAIGAAQAVFFALFTGVFGILSIYEERRQWTLQRLLVSPTPPITILLGKLLGNLVVVLAQLLLLLVALTLIASVVIGRPTFVWGGNVLALLLVTLALSLCVSGFGVLIVGLARTQQQVQVIGPMVNMALGVLGGTFGFSLPQSFSQLSLIYWGVDAYQKLARGQMNLGPNLLVLCGQGIVLFVVGAWLFKRRMEL